MKLALITFALMTAMPAIAQDQVPAAPQPPPVVGADQNPEPLAIASGDAFAGLAAIINLFEIESSTAALERAESEEVKAFAQDMIDAHTAATPLLASAAEGQGVELPTDLNEAYRGKVDALEQLEGAAFDEAYVSAQITAHEEALTLFQSYRDLQDETPLNAFASDMIDDLEAHLAEVRALDR